MNYESSTIFSLCGLATLTYFTYSLTRRYLWTPFKLYFIAQKWPGVDLRKHGDWAVVTGATDGIGKGYAKAFAKRGLNVVLISRSTDKLEKVAAEMKKEYNVQVKIITADFSRTDIYERIAVSLHGLDIGVLVNNVGMGHAPELFLEVDDLQNKYRDMIAVNCTAITEMCTIVLPGMVTRNRGVVINISSMFARGTVIQPVYAACKTFVSMLSDLLRRTYCRNASGVIIHLLEPGMVLTNLLDEAIPEEVFSGARKYASVTVDSYVNASLNTVGWCPMAEGTFTHWLIGALSVMRSDSAVDNQCIDSLIPKLRSMKKSN